MSATSDNEVFSTSSSGIGLYYHGRGEQRIGPDVFRQIEQDSDRSAAIVAGSMVEKRLEGLLRSATCQDPKVADQFYKITGPIGSFSAKIQMCYLLSLISHEAMNDLDHMKTIRNIFAHDLNYDSFSNQKIRDLCRNIKIVERYVGPASATPTENNEAVFEGHVLDVVDPETIPTPYRELDDHEVKLEDPRFRYIMSASIYSYLLGRASDNLKGPFPVV